MGVCPVPNYTLIVAASKAYLPVCPSAHLPRSRTDVARKISPHRHCQHSPEHIHPPAMPPARYVSPVASTTPAPPPPPAFTGAYPCTGNASPRATSRQLSPHPVVPTREEETHAMASLRRRVPGHTPTPLHIIHEEGATSHNHHHRSYRTTTIRVEVTAPPTLSTRWYSPAGADASDC